MIELLLFVAGRMLSAVILITGFYVYFGTLFASIYYSVFATGIKQLIAETIFILILFFSIRMNMPDMEEGRPLMECLFGPSSKKHKNQH